MQRNNPSHCWVSEMMPRANADALHWQLAAKLPDGIYELCNDDALQGILWNWLVGSSINIVLIDTKRSRDPHGNWSNLIGPMQIKSLRWSRPKSCAETLSIPPRPIWDPPNSPTRFGNWRHNIRRILVIVGDELLAQNFPMIHAVRRAAEQEPRLIDLKWGSAGPKVTFGAKAFVSIQAGWI